MVLAELHFLDESYGREQTLWFDREKIAPILPWSVHFEHKNIQGTKAIVRGHRFYIRTNILPSSGLERLVERVFDNNFEQAFLHIPVVR